MKPVLILGGTLDASRLATAVAATGRRAVLSYAGRVAEPREQPVPVRVGGFGGAEGLAAWIRREEISAIIDATHPFAARISANAVAAAKATETPLLALERAPWVPGPGDDWREVADIPAAVAALAGPPQRIFLAIGRQHLDEFATVPQHHYLLRLVDAPQGSLQLPRAAVVVSRGPFTEAEDLALLCSHRIDMIVAKNAGGEGASAKLAAARSLGLPVLMIARPAIPRRPVARSVAEVMGWLGHAACLGV